MKLDILRRLNDARERRIPAILVTDVASGAERLVTEAENYSADPLREKLESRFRSGASGLEDGTFFTVHLPAPRFVIIGAVHISQALAPMAAIAGFDVTIIDPRTAFATADRFPNLRLLAEWPDMAIPKVGLDPFTALAVVTHDPKIDDPALLAAFAARCFYIGALGSRKTHGKRVERLKAGGAADADLARIAAPIGLPIRAQSPAEIAVAILAQVIEALRSRGVAGTGAVA